MARSARARGLCSSGTRRGSASWSCGRSNFWAGACTACWPRRAPHWSNVTTALNIVARSLRLEPGDEVLTINHEYGALDRTWTFVSEHRQSRVVVQKLPVPIEDPEDVVEAVWAGVTPRHASSS